MKSATRDKRFKSRTVQDVPGQLVAKYASSSLTPPELGL